MFDVRQEGFLMRAEGCRIVSPMLRMGMLN